MNESLDAQHKMETDGNHEKTAKVGVLAENYFFTLVIQKNSCYFLWPSTTKVTNHNYQEYQLVLYSDGGILPYYNPYLLHGPYESCGNVSMLNLSHHPTGEQLLA